VSPVIPDLLPKSVRADPAVKVTDKNYLDAEGFSVFLYDSTYHPVFVDQKNTAMEMILHGKALLPTATCA